MANLEADPKFSDEQIAKAKVIGQAIEERINYSSFNAVPTDSKIASLYHELKVRGCRLPPTLETTRRIRGFFERRTEQNQEELFRSLTNLKLTEDLLEALTLDYQTSRISEKNLEQTVEAVFTLLKELKDLTDIEKLGLTQQKIHNTLKRMYEVPYNTTVYRFSIDRLSIYLQAEVDASRKPDWSRNLTLLLDAINPACLTRGEMRFLESVRDCPALTAVKPLPQLRGKDFHPEITRFLRGIRTFNQRLTQSPEVSLEQAEKFRRISSMLAGKILRSFENRVDTDVAVSGPIED